MSRKRPHKLFRRKISTEKSRTLFFKNNCLHADVLTVNFFDVLTFYIFEISFSKLKSTFGNDGNSEWEMNDQKPDIQGDFYSFDIFHSCPSLKNFKAGTSGPELPPSHLNKTCSCHYVGTLFYVLSKTLLWNLSSVML